MTYTNIWTTNLISHELDEEPILGCQSCRFKVLRTESRKAVVEKIQLDPLLIKRYSQREVVEITQRV